MNENSTKSGATKPRRRTLPGDLPYDEQVKRMIRVDHAGEYGAVRIYTGQLATLKDGKTRKLVEHMAEQEHHHLDTFNRMVVERRVRPTALMPLWHVGGWLLGAGTALLGKEAAMACTVAVESVIEQHYAGQEQALGEDEQEQELKTTIAKFRAEEMEHHDTGIKEGAEQAPLHPLLDGAIRSITRTAIWLSTRV